MTKNKERKYGRKSLADKWITYEGLVMIEGWARTGLVNKQIAKNIGITEQTLYNWLKKHPEISEALKKGKEVIDFEIENAMYKRALGYEAEDVKTYKRIDGKGNETQHVEKTKKHIPGDVTAQIFWLKNRQPDKWNENYQLEHTGSVDISVQNDLFTKYLLEDDKDDN